MALVLELSLADLVRGHEMQRLVRQGVPFRTPTYTVDGHMVWGATARIVQSLLERLQPSCPDATEGGAQPGRRRASTGPQTSFSIGTATMLPHSVQDPS